MKKLLFTLIALLNILAFYSCSSNNDELLSDFDNTQELVPEADFGRGNTLQFYFLDEKNNGIIKESDRTTFPILLSDSIKIERQQSLDSIKQIDEFFIHKQGLLSILFDKEENLHYTNIILPGLAGKTSNQFYISLPGFNTDKVVVEFKITNKNVIGARTYAYIKALYYNNKLVYSETDKQKWSNKIFIQKSNDTTTLSFKRP